MVKTAPDRPVSPSGWTVEPLDGEHVVVTAPDADEDAEHRWRTLADGGAEWAAPVLESPDGQESYPTGDVVVRFAEAPSDDELARWGEREHLSLVGRNRYVPEQASYRPERPASVFLPGLCARVESRPEVAAAWPGTRARYTRVGEG